MKPEAALQKAIALCGGHVALAKALKINRQAVHKWRQCPASRAIPLEIATGRKITRFQLRPDIYPREAA